MTPKTAFFLVLTLVVGRAETPGERALRITLENRRQIGRPPVEAAGEPGSGLWAVLAKLNDKMGKVVAWTEAEDEARKSRGGMLAVIGREILRGAIPLIVLAVSAYLAGFHR